MGQAWVFIIKLATTISHDFELSYILWVSTFDPWPLLSTEAHRAHELVDIWSPSFYSWWRSCWKRLGVFPKFCLIASEVTWIENWMCFQGFVCWRRRDANRKLRRERKGVRKCGCFVRPAVGESCRDCNVHYFVREALQAGLIGKPCLRYYKKETTLIQGCSSSSHSSRSSKVLDLLLLYRYVVETIWPSQKTFVLYVYSFMYLTQRQPASSKYRNSAGLEICWVPVGLDTVK